MTMTEEQYRTRTSPWPVAETVQRLTGLIGARGLTVFTTIDQRAEAVRVGLELRDTVLIVFGSPKAGTPVMQARPLAALDLPLKLLVWEDGEHTSVSYLRPAVLAERHMLDEALAAPLAAIDGLVSAALQSDLG